MHIAVMLRSDVFRHGQARCMAHAPSPLDVFRETQGVLVRMLQGEQLVLPKLGDCVAKLEGSGQPAS